ncbi:hypothetical protein GFM44_30790 [Rhizobium leguminosarum bv. viciae]|nr:hypothetical protein [Rhizobium leguminosarum bv. viciae]
MFKELSADELQAREDDIFLNFMSRKWALEAAGVTPTHDKLFCLWKSKLPKLHCWKTQSDKGSRQTRGLFSTSWRHNFHKVDMSPTGC